MFPSRCIEQYTMSRVPCTCEKGLDGVIPLGDQTNISCRGSPRALNPSDAADRVRGSSRKIIEVRRQSKLIINPFP